MKWLNTEYQLSLMFQLQDRVYNLGARNFVFFTVPPFDRTPWGMSLRLFSQSNFRPEGPVAFNAH